MNCSQEWLFCVACSFLVSVVPISHASVSVIPALVQMELQDGTFLLTSDTKIIVDAETTELGGQLREMLSPATGYSLGVTDTSTSSNNVIYLKLDSTLKDLGEEGYCV